MGKLLRIKQHTGLFFLVAFIITIFEQCNKPLLFEAPSSKDSTAITLRQKKLLLITLQGARGAVMKDADIPHIQSLVANSIYSWDAVCDSVSTDAAGWAALFTGVHNMKNGVSGYSYLNNRFDLYPSFFSYLRQGGHPFRIIGVNDAPSLNDTLLFKQDVDMMINPSDDQAVADSAVGRLMQDNPDVMLVNFEDINTAGIQYGFSGAAYQAAIHTTDGYIGKILNALKARKNYASEDWLIVITSNHGGTDTGTYGGSGSDERNTFVLYSNSRFTSQEIRAPLVNVPYNGIYPMFYRSAGTDHAAYTNDPKFHFGADQDFTIEFNIRSTNASGDDHPVISNKNWGSGSNTGYAIYKQNGNLRINYKGTDASRIDMRNGPYVADGKWHHITVTFDRGGVISFYMDGDFFVSGPSIKDNGSIDATYPFVIGTDGTLNYSYNGPDGSGDNYISDIRVWNTVLSPTTIANWAFIPLTEDHPNYANLIGYWKANDATGAATLKDYSVSHADLTIKNGLQWDEIDDVLNPSNINPSLYVPASVDVSTNVLAWMGLKVDPLWHLDGKIWILQ